MTSIVKLARPSVNFEQIPRALIQHARLSQDAKWLPIWLAAKPPAWEIRSAALMKDLGWTKERYYRAVKMLAEEGYWSHHKFQDELGTFWHQYEVRLEPVEPPAEPCAGNPASGYPDSGRTAPLVNTIQKNTKNNNNNPATPVAEKQEVVVVVSDFFVDQNLLEKSEVAELKQAALLIKNIDPQRLVDEVCGQVRKKGRLGPRGIKHPLRLLRAIVSSKVLDYANDEQERREAKLRPIVLRTEPPPVPNKGTPPPVEFTEFVKKMKGMK